MVEILRLIWRSGQRQLIFEVDSVDVVNILISDAKNGRDQFNSKSLGLFEGVGCGYPTCLQGR